MSLPIKIVLVLLAVSALGLIVLSSFNPKLAEQIVFGIVTFTFIGGGGLLILVVPKKDSQATSAWFWGILAIFIGCFFLLAFGSLVGWWNTNNQLMLSESFSPPRSIQHTQLPTSIPPPTPPPQPDKLTLAFRYYDTLPDWVKNAFWLYSFLLVLLGIFIHSILKRNRK